MLLDYHRGLKGIVLFFFSIFCLDFLPAPKWKCLNVIKLMFFPICMSYGIFCSLWHLVYQRDGLTERQYVMHTSFSIIFSIGFTQSIAIHLTIVLNKKDILEVLSAFEKLLQTENDPVSHLREKHYIKNLRIAFLIARNFLRFFRIFTAIMVAYYSYASKYHLPAFFYIPGTPLNSTFFYAFNFFVQTILFFGMMEEVFGSDAVIMTMILYCDAELRTVEELITNLDGKSHLRDIHNVHIGIYQKTQQLTKCFWHVYFQKLFCIMGYFVVELFNFQTYFPIYLSVLTAMLILSQIFILCYSGQIIQNSSENMADSLYMSNWYELKAEDQRDFLMLLIGLRLPIKMETFGFGIISINSFVQICKASFSYAAILYTVFM